MIASPIYKAASDDLDSTATNRGLAAICRMKVKLECIVSDMRVNAIDALPLHCGRHTRPLWFERDDHPIFTCQESSMKRFATALVASMLLASPLFALDATQAKKDVATATAAPAKAVPADAKKAPELMDINHATAKQLATLDGIGEARSAAIVKGRPYNGKDDLVNKKILTQDVYDKIKDKIIAKQKK